MCVKICEEFDCQDSLLQIIKKHLLVFMFNLIFAFELRLKGITLKLKLINISSSEENYYLQMFSDQILSKAENGFSFQ